jgi:hypothetical protein
MNSKFFLGIEPNCSFGGADLQAEPAFGIDPVGTGRGGGHTEGLGGLFERETSEIAEFNELGLAGMELFEFLVRLVQGKEVEWFTGGLVGDVL